MGEERVVEVSMVRLVDSGPQTSLLGSIVQVGLPLLFALDRVGHQIWREERAFWG